MHSFDSKLYFKPHEVSSLTFSSHVWFLYSHIFRTHIFCIPQNHLSDITVMTGCPEPILLPSKLLCLLGFLLNSLMLRKMKGNLFLLGYLLTFALPLSLMMILLNFVSLIHVHYLLVFLISHILKITAKLVRVRLAWQVDFLLPIFPSSYLYFLLLWEILNQRYRKRTQIMGTG